MSGFSQPARFPPWRYRLGVACVVAVTLFFIAKLVAIELSEGAKFREAVEKSTKKNMGIHALRGSIVDRHGNYLAISLHEFNVQAYNLKWSGPEQLQRLVELLEPYEEKPGHILRQINDIESTTSQITLAKNVSLGTKRELEIMSKYCQIEGLSIVPSKRGRYYPTAEAGGLLTGFINSEGEGKDGLERAFEAQLRPKHGTAVRTEVEDLNKSATGCYHRREVDRHVVIPARDGQVLQTSLDRVLQIKVYGLLAKHAKKNAAKVGGSAAVINAETGEILALANYPSFPPNNLPPQERWTSNHAVQSIIEPGSTIKPFIFAAGMERGVLTPEDTIDLSKGLRVGGKTFRDQSLQGVMTRRQALVRSSQVAAVDAVLKLSKEEVKSFLQRMGFTKSLDLKLGASLGNINMDSKLPSFGYGYGMAVNLLQLMRAYAVFANGGYMVKLSLEKSDRAYSKKRVLEPLLASTMRDMLYGVVEDVGGTGFRARVKGFYVGGKTGTAQIHSSGYDGSRFNSNFVGFVGNNPAYVVGVWLFDVGPERFYASKVAAPLAKDIFKEVINTQGLLPSNGEPIGLAVSSVEVEP